MLGLEVVVAPVDVRRERASDVTDLFRVQTVEPLGGLVRDLVIFKPEHFLPARGEVDHVRLEVPVPQPIVRATDGQRIALLALAQRRLRLPATQLGLDPRHRHGEVDGLGHIVVRTRVQCRDNVVTLVTGRHHDDWELGRRVRLTDDLQHLEPAQPRHLDVEQDQREGPCRNQLQGLLAIDGNRHVVALSLEPA